ncbi:MAG: hypothetical protein NXH89_02810 [Cyclobacteriaceae bacterium]|nr:hypothetical protein [Cyclobacteriaceae bacterium]
MAEECRAECPAFGNAGQRDSKEMVNKNKNPPSDPDRYRDSWRVLRLFVDFVSSLSALGASHSQLKITQPL